MRKNIHRVCVNKQIKRTKTRNVKHTHKTCYIWLFYNSAVLVCLCLLLIIRPRAQRGDKISISPDLQWKVWQPRVTQSRGHGSHSRDDLWWSHRCHNNAAFPPCHSLTTPALPCIEIYPNRIRSIKSKWCFLFEVKNICVETSKPAPSSWVTTLNPHNLLRVKVHQHRLTLDTMLLIRRLRKLWHNLNNPTHTVHEIFDQ